MSWKLVSASDRFMSFSPTLPLGWILRQPCMPAMQCIQEEKMACLPPLLALLLLSSSSWSLGSARGRFSFASPRKWANREKRMRSACISAVQ